jgi:hypothetical protein
VLRYDYAATHNAIRKCHSVLLTPFLLTGFSATFFTVTACPLFIPAAIPDFGFKSLAIFFKVFLKKETKSDGGEREKDEEERVATGE